MLSGDAGLSLRDGLVRAILAKADYIIHIENFGEIIEISLVVVTVWRRLQAPSHDDRAGPLGKPTAVKCFPIERLRNIVILYATTVF